MTDLSSLIERLEKATGPDREIDCQIAFATGHFDFKLRYGFEHCRIERGEHRSADWVEVLVKNKGTLIYQEAYPAYTSSIDAAVALAESVLTGVELEITNLYGVARVTLHHETGQFYGSSAINSLPMAIVLATLIALQSKGPEA